MTDNSNAYETVETDVLVIGGGGAGCMAAIEAHDQGVDVVMMLKGRLGHSGCTVNVGTSAAVGPWSEQGDATHIAMRDLLAHGGFLGDQDLAKILVDESAECVLELERWGIDFDRNDDGSIAIYWSPAHTYPRNFTFKPKPDSRHDYGFAPGFAMMDVFAEQVGKRRVRVVEDVMLVDLLTAEGRVVGATGLDYLNSKPVVFKAMSTVLATGTYSQVFAPTTVSAHETGDGQAAAYRAGAELIDMESTQFVSTSIGFPPGTVFLNGRGERFLEKYDIESPRDVTKEEMCYAIWTEIREGRGTDRETILLDMTAPFREDPGSKWAPIVETQMEEVRRGHGGSVPERMDPFKSPVESFPKAHTTIGGIRIDERCQTGVPGLYATGAAAGGVYGLARPEGYTSMITLVFGKRAGLFAAQASMKAGGFDLDDRAVAAGLESASRLASGSAGATADELKVRIQALLRKHAWVIKEEGGLREALRQIMAISDSYPVMRASDGHGWASALETRNMLLSAELMLVGSIERKESRGAFFRAEYPNTDNKSWLKNITYRQVDGDLALGAVSVDLKYCGPTTQGGVTAHRGRWVDEE